MPTYKWDIEGLSPLDAQSVGEELERLRLANGKLTKEIVLEAAKHRNSPLHDHFEWDDTEAAKKFRLVQARNLIRHVVVVFESRDSDEKLETRAFVSISSQDENKLIYTSIEDAMSDELMREEVFKNALDALNNWKKKYANLEIFLDVFKAIEKLNEMAKRRTEIRARVKR